MTIASKPHRYKTEVTVSIESTKVEVRCTRCGYGMRKDFQSLGRIEPMTKDEEKAAKASGRRFAKSMVRTMKAVDCFEFMVISLHES